MLFYLLSLLLLATPVSLTTTFPKFDLASLKDISILTDDYQSQRYYHELYFLNDQTLLVGSMNYIFSADLYEASVKLTRSVKFPFDLEDDPLFLCHQNGLSKQFCGSHIRTIIPLSSLSISADRRNGSMAFSLTDDALVCATSGKRKGSSLYIMNIKKLNDLRKINMDTSSTIHEDDPFATPHELYFTARMLCPEFPDQNYAYVVTSINNSSVFVTSLWLRKFGIQMKLFNKLNILPKEGTRYSSQAPAGVLDFELTSTLHQSDKSLLGGIGEFAGVHLVDSEKSTRNGLLALLKKEKTSAIIFADITETKSIPANLDAPFDKTFSITIASLIACESVVSRPDCLRHGFCFKQSFVYSLIKDFKVIKGYLFALFSTAQASWGSRSALCMVKVDSVLAILKNCKNGHEKVYSSEMLHCNTLMSVPALYEAEWGFSKLAIVEREEGDSMNVAISTNEGSILKGHLRKVETSPDWNFIISSELVVPHRKEISKFAWHSSSQRLFFTTDTYVASFSFQSICSKYDRIRHCLKDDNCDWNYENRACESKVSPSVNRHTKSCPDVSEEIVDINASQGSTVRLICNPPCVFDSAVKWDIDSKVNENKYLVSGDILVIFDLFASRSKSNSSSVISISCSTVSPSPKRLVTYSIHKTCGTLCQRTRNMEAWCLRTWKQKIGIPN